MNQDPGARFNVYIDGFNLFYKLKEAKQRDPNNRRVYWLDLEKLGRWFQSLLPGWELSRVKFFTSPAATRASYQNQHRYWRALESRSKVERFDGEFKKKTVKCRVKPPACGSGYSYDIFSEKRTDVSMGVEMVSDCLENQVQGIIVVTRDTDQVPSLAKIKELRPRVVRVVASPPGEEAWPEALVSLSSKIKDLPDLSEIKWPVSPEGRCRRNLAAGKFCLEPGLQDLISCRFPPQVKCPVRRSNSKASPRTETIEEPEDWRVSR